METKTVKPRLKKGDNITVIGKRWFHRGPGNTYHSVEVIVNGQSVYTNPYSYGYGDHYVQTAMEYLKQAYKFPKGFDVDRSPMWQLHDLGINVITRVSDVQRKKDL